MQYRKYLAILLVSSAAACSSGSDSPSGPSALAVSAARIDDGVKPPPPAGSEDVDIFISISPGESEFADAAAAAIEEPFPGFSARVSGRYFANTESTNGWIDFEDNEVVEASTGARISYNERQQRGNGRGTLTIPGDPGDPDVVLDLSKLVIVSGFLRACAPFAGEGGGICAILQVEYLGNPGSIFVTLSSRETAPG